MKRGGKATNLKLHANTKTDQSLGLVFQDELKSLTYHPLSFILWNQTEVMRSCKGQCFATLNVSYQLIKVERRHWLTLSLSLGFLKWWDPAVFTMKGGLIKHHLRFLGEDVKIYYIYIIYILLHWFFSHLHHWTGNRI